MKISWRGSFKEWEISYTRTSSCTLNSYGGWEVQNKITSVKPLLLWWQTFSQQLQGNNFRLTSGHRFCWMCPICFLVRKSVLWLVNLFCPVLSRLFIRFIPFGVTGGYTKGKGSVAPQSRCVDIGFCKTFLHCQLCKGVSWTVFCISLLSYPPKQVTSVYPLVFFERRRSTVHNKTWKQILT